MIADNGLLDFIMQMSEMQMAQPSTTPLMEQVLLNFMLNLQSTRNRVLGSRRSSRMLDTRSFEATHWIGGKLERKEL